MITKLSFAVERITNGYVVRNETTGLAEHVSYDFGIVRAIERLAGTQIKGLDEPPDKIPDEWPDMPELISEVVSALPSAA